MERIGVMKKFVAISDDMLDNQPQVLGRLIPYSCDYPCQRLYRQPLEDSSECAPVQGTLLLQQGGKGHEAL